MMDLTVRRVATFLRLPWWISIVTIFFLGREKQTARWERSFVSLPGGEQVVSDLEYQWFEYRREVARWVDWVYAGNGERFESLPRGPSTVTTRDRMWILTFSGISSCS